MYLVEKVISYHVKVALYLILVNFCDSFVKTDKLNQH